MRFPNFLLVSFRIRKHLKELHSKSRPPDSLCDLERLILEELHGFAEKNQTFEIFPQILILNLKKMNRGHRIWAKLRLLRRILRTPGQLRWLSSYFFTPVLNIGFEISRGRLLRIILFNWRKFSEEVLIHLDLVEGDTQKFREIPIDLFSNPNAKVSLTPEVPYLLKSEYFPNFIYSSKYKSFLQKYLMGRIILWNPSYAITFIENSDQLMNSEDFRKFLDAAQHFKQQITSRTKLKFEFHHNSAFTFDQRLDNPTLSLPDRVSNAEIWHQRFIIAGDRFLLIDVTCSPLLKFVAGHWQFLEQVNAKQDDVRLRTPADFRQINLDEAIFLIGRADENWYHLLLDTLPRYLCFETINRDVPVLVRSDLPKTSIDLLRQLIPRTLIFLEPNDKVSVKLLHFYAGRSTVFDSKPINKEDQVQFSPKVLARTKSWFLGTLKEDPALVYPTNFYMDRIAKYRNVINAKGVISECRTNDYEILECTNQFFLNQSHYFAKADHIVSPGGAVLANIVFMKKGSKITLIRSWRDADLLLWKKLADSCGVDFTEAIGIPTYYGRKMLARQHSDFYLPMRAIRKLLKS